MPRLSKRQKVDVPAATNGTGQAKKQNNPHPMSQWVSTCKDFAKLPQMIFHMKNVGGWRNRRSRGVAREIT